MWCVICGESFDPNRAKLGYKTCLVCGEQQSKRVVRCVVALNKSCYQPVWDLDILKQLNPKCVNL